MGGRVECGKRLSNVLLQEGLELVEAMRADPGWEAAQKIPRSDPEARAAAFQAVRNQHDFNEFHFNRRATYHKKKAGFLGRIGSEESQNIAKHVYDSLNDWVVGVSTAGHVSRASSAPCTASKASAILAT